jgi:hypothetical protein
LLGLVPFVAVLFAARICLMTFRDRSVSRAIAIVLACAVAGCTTGMGAVIDSARDMVRRGDSTGAAPLDPNFEYLRITRQGHVGMLWRGNIEKSAAGPVEVFYSGSGEVLRLHDGHVVNALGLTTEWRRVTGTAPRWRDVAAAGQTARYQRTRDVMPGYRTGIRDDLVLRVIPAPSGSALRDVEAGELTWFEERVETRSRLPFGLGRSPDALPPARYAVDLRGDDAKVVYAEQCLADDLCFTWQRWSAAMQKAAVAR